MKYLRSCDVMPALLKKLGLDGQGVQRLVLDFQARDVARVYVQRLLPDTPGLFDDLPGDMVVKEVKSINISDKGEVSAV